MKAMEDGKEVQGGKRKGTETYRKVKVVIAQITTSVGRLHHHLLARDRPGCEGELVAGAAPARLVAARDAHRRPAVRQVLADRPRPVRAAHVRRPALLAPGRRRPAVLERVVVDVARPHGVVRPRRVGRPRARRLAAVPVPRRAARARRLRRRQRGHVGREEGEEGREGNGGLHRGLRSSVRLFLGCRVYLSVSLRHAYNLQPPQG